MILGLNRGQMQIYLEILYYDINAISFVAQRNQGPENIFSSCLTSETAATIPLIHYTGLSWALSWKNGDFYVSKFTSKYQSQSIQSSQERLPR